MLTIPSGISAKSFKIVRYGLPISSRAWKEFQAFFISLEYLSTCGSDFEVKSRKTTCASALKL
jgi:hypothetical protein